MQAFHSIWALKQYSQQVQGDFSFIYADAKLTVKLAGFSILL